MYEERLNNYNNNHCWQYNVRLNNYNEDCRNSGIDKKKLKL